MTEIKQNITSYSDISNNDSNVTVSVIIVNYNTGHLLINAIDSIIKHTEDITFEIIIVDNNSSDNSQTLISNQYIGNVRYISLSANIGFGKANNEGVKNASGKYLFFLNSDTILINNAIKILSTFLDNNPKTGICGGNLFTEKLKPAHSFMPVLPSLFLEIDSIFNHAFLKLFWGIPFDFNKSGCPQKVADIIGADLMIRKSLFIKVEGFDPEFFLYNEESELAYRIQQIGYSVYSVPEAQIIHLEGKSMSSDISKFKFGLISRKIYYKKTHKFFLRILIDLVFTFKCTLGIVISIITLKKEYVQYWFFALKKGMIEIW